MTPINCRHRHHRRCHRHRHHHRPQPARGTTEQRSGHIIIPTKHRGGRRQTTSRMDGVHGQSVGLNRPSQPIVEELLVSAAVKRVNRSERVQNKQHQRFHALGAPDSQIVNFAVAPQRTRRGLGMKIQIGKFKQWCWHTHSVCCATNKPSEQGPNRSLCECDCRTFQSSDLI